MLGLFLGGGSVDCGCGRQRSTVNNSIRDDNGGGDDDADTVADACWVLVVSADGGEETAAAVTCGDCCEDCCSGGCGSCKQDNLSTSQSIKIFDRASLLVDATTAE